MLCLFHYNIIFYQFYILLNYNIIFNQFCMLLTLFYFNNFNYNFIYYVYRKSILDFNLLSLVISSSHTTPSTSQHAQWERNCMEKHNLFVHYSNFLDFTQYFPKISVTAQIRIYFHILCFICSLILM